MTRVRSLVLTGYGLNCDVETAHALTLAGASADRIHINALISGDVTLTAYQILVFGGGFSWGDDHGAGVIQAIRMKTRIGEQMIRFVEDGNLILGVCNGFQTLVNLGLLPGLDADYRTRSVALINNDCGNFRNQWVHLSVNPTSPCVFTRGMTQLELPVRHGEGKFYAAPQIIDRLRVQGQVVLRYALADGRPAGGAFPLNPNGALDDIAGICDPTGRVFGLMPHPEAYNHWSNHPDAFRRPNRLGNAPWEITPGIQMFKNAIDFMS